VNRKLRVNRKLSLLLLLFPMVSLAESVVIQSERSTQLIGNTSVTQSLDEEKPITGKLQANIALHTLAELQQLLERAESIANGETLYNTEDPIAVVLHGEEINAFLRSNYRTNKPLVDLAARLDAFNVIDVKVCRRWMGANGIMANDLPPFIEPVPFGAGEVQRLKAAGYAYF
jgi:uncharacterized protein